MGTPPTLTRRVRWFGRNGLATLGDSTAADATAAPTPVAADAAVGALKPAGDAPGARTASVEAAVVCASTLSIFVSQACIFPLLVGHNRLILRPKEPDRNQQSLTAQFRHARCGTSGKGDRAAFEAARCNEHEAHTFCKLRPIDKASSSCLPKAAANEREIPSHQSTPDDKRGITHRQIGPFRLRESIPPPIFRKCPLHARAVRV